MAPTRNVYWGLLKTPAIYRNENGSLFVYSTRLLALKLFNEPAPRSKRRPLFPFRSSPSLWRRTGAQRLWTPTAKVSSPEMTFLLKIATMLE